MRKFGLVFLVLALMFAASGCSAGPHQLQRTVDDWDHRLYVESPWMNAVLWVVPVIPILNMGAKIGDFFVVDAYSFWFKDAWDGTGTGFRHLSVDATDGAMSSLLMDDGKFMEVK